MRPAVPLVLLLALLTSACAQRAVPSPPAEALLDELFISCASVFEPGVVIDETKAKVACAGVDGKALTPQYLTCTDGTHLWRIDDTMSETPGWGFTNSPFLASDDLENDPGLAAALVDCRR